MKTTYNIKTLVVAGIALMAMSATAQTRHYDNIVVRHNGEVVYTNRATDIDSIAMEQNKTRLSLYDKEGALLFSTPAAGCKMDVEQGAPVADVLDLVFNEDGTATDISDMGNAVTGSGATTYYNNTYRRYVARFDNKWAGATTAYYRIDYEGNANFIGKLSDGHTLEAVVMADYTPPIINGEAKFFSSHEAGGTGLMVCKTSGSRGNELTFLPNVSTTGKSVWRWATSGVVPQPKQYYHVVGVWDKDAKVAKVYINGQLRNTVEADGNLVLPKAGSQWFGVGCDAGPTAQLGWIGDVVMARVYDAPLGDGDVARLWDEVKRLQDTASPTLVSDVQFCDGLAVKAGCSYPVVGKGFEQGDRLRMQMRYNASATYDLPCTLTSLGVAVTMPEGIESGSYRMSVVRGDNTQMLGTVSVVAVAKMPAGAKVIAHRGAWNDTDASQNSRASLKEALDMNVYGSETDVWMTTDGHLMINHDATLNGVSMENSAYSEVRDLKLKNGETIPQLQDFLDALKASASQTKLIIELKEHSTTARNVAAAKAIVEAVQAAGVQDKVEYISFSLDGCKAFCKADPSAKVAYLRGGVAPADLLRDGINGLDYHIAEFRNHTGWIDEAHRLGMTANVWTVDALKDMAEMTNMNVDFITTNNPAEATVLKNYYDEGAKTNNE